MYLKHTIGCIIISFTLHFTFWYQNVSNKEFLTKPRENTGRVDTIGDKVVLVPIIVVFCFSLFVIVTVPLYQYRGKVGILSCKKSFIEKTILITLPTGKK